MVATKDKCCTIVPYFKVHDGHLDDFKKKCEEFMQATDSESKCLYYGFTFNGNACHLCNGSLAGVAQAALAAGADLQDSGRIGVHRLVSASKDRG